MDKNEVRFLNEGGCGIGDSKAPGRGTSSFEEKASSEAFLMLSDMFLNTDVVDRAVCTAWVVALGVDDRARKQQRTLRLSLCMLSN